MALLSGPSFLLVKKETPVIEPEPRKDEMIYFVSSTVCANLCDLCKSGSLLFLRVGLLCHVIGTST